MYKVEYTKDELDALLIQIDFRIDSLKQLQIDEAKKGKVERVIEIENFIKPLISGRDKMREERFRR